MFSVKFVIACCFALAAVAQARNDYLFGTIAPTDVLIGSATIDRKVFLVGSNTYDYVFTQTAATPLTITGIRITDNKLWKGATAAVTAGGVGDTTATITFTGKPGSAIKSTIEIYGVAA